MTYAETVFVVQTTEPAILAECLHKGCYGITRKAFHDNLPAELRDLPSNAALFIRLKDSLQQISIFGPLFLRPAPSGIVVGKSHGIWRELDADRNREDRIPSFARGMPWCFFFDPPDAGRFGLIDDGELEAQKISLPPWGVLPAWKGRKLIAMAKGRLAAAVDHLEILGVKLSTGGSSPVASKVVLTLPSHIRQEFSAAGIASSPTFETLREIMAGARESIKVFSPYLDATFINLVRDVAVPVRIVTTPHKDRVQKPNPILERLAANQDVEVRYIAEESRGAHLYQLHAKMILCDATAAYVGSANLTDTSVYTNIELGVLVTESGMIGELHRVFDTLFERYAFRSKDFADRRRASRRG